jgi:hypothetical protein
MASFDCDMYHNLIPSKMNNPNGWWISIFQKNHQKILIVPCVKFWWMNEKWHYGCNHRGVAL